MVDMTTMDAPERWKPHGSMSAPGNGPLNFDGLPADVGWLRARRRELLASLADLVPPG